MFKANATKGLFIKYSFTIKKDLFQLATVNLLLSECIMGKIIEFQCIIFIVRKKIFEINKDTLWERNKISYYLLYLYIRLPPGKKGTWSTIYSNFNQFHSRKGFSTELGYLRRDYLGYFKNSLHRVWLFLWGKSMKLLNVKVHQIVVFWHVASRLNPL